MSSSLLLPGLVLGAALTVGMAIGLAKAIDKLTFGIIRPRLIFSDHNDDLLEEIEILLEDNDALLEENKCLREENVSLRYGSTTTVIGPSCRYHDRDHATLARTNTRSCRYVGVVEPSTPLSAGRRAASESPARQVGLGDRAIRGAERAEGARRAAEWARKRKEKKTS